MTPCIIPRITRGDGAGLPIRQFTQGGGRHSMIRGMGATRVMVGVMVVDTAMVRADTVQREQLA